MYLREIETGNAVCLTVTPKWKCRMKDRRQAPTYIESLCAFELPDTIQHPPCGELHPEVTTLTLRRLHTGQACYVSSASTNGAVPAFVVESVHSESLGGDRNDAVRIRAAGFDDRAKFELGAAPEVTDGVKTATGGIKTQTGSTPDTTFTDIALRDMRDVVSKGVAAVAYSQAAVRDVALRSRDIQDVVLDWPNSMRGKECDPQHIAASDALPEGATLLDRVVMPPCGELFPDGSSLELGANAHGHISYSTESWPGNRHKVVQAFAIEQADDDSIRIRPVPDGDWDRLGLDRSRGITARFDDAPVGIAPETTIGRLSDFVEPRALAQAVADGVADLAFAQAAVYTIAVEERDRALAVEVKQKQRGITR